MNKVILVILVFITYGVYLLGYIKEIYAVGICCALLGGLLSKVFSGIKLSSRGGKGE